MDNFHREYLKKRPPDPEAKKAKEELIKFFNDNRDQVYYSKQFEVILEDTYLHWITNRVLNELVREGILKLEKRLLNFGGSINIYRHKSLRDYKRKAARLVKLVNEFSDPNFTASLGQTGELLVLEGFARSGFAMRGRSTKALDGREWTETDHNLDFIFEKDSINYGIEVKNTLHYMNQDEFKVYLIN